MVDVAHDGDDRRARRQRRSGSSATSNRPSSTSASATRRTVWPISSAISCAVSASITSLIVTIWPCCISRRMTSTARSDMRLARSWMVIASGIVTSRTSFSFGSLEAWPLSRWVRRRNEATERSRTSSARSAVTSVRRPRCFSAPARGAARGTCGRTRRRRRTARRAALPPRRLRAPARAADRRALGLFLAEALLGDFAGLALGFFLALVALVLLALARFGGFALGCGRRLRARRGGALLPRRSCALRLRARASRPAHARARRVSSSVSVRSTTPEAFGASAGAGAAAAGLRRGRGRALLRRFGRRRLGLGFGRAADRCGV